MQSDDSPGRELLLQSLADLTHRELEVREQAVAALMRIGAESLPALAAILQESGHTGRVIAARTLAQMGAGSASAALRRHLDDPDARVREWCAVGLGRLRDAGAVPNLQARAHDESFPVANAAVEALATIGGQKTVVALLKLVDDPHLEHLKAELCVALGQMQDGRARKRLFALLASGDPNARLAAIGGLGVTGDSAVLPHLLMAKERFTPFVRELRYRQDREPDEERFIADYERERAAILTAVGQIGGVAAVAVLVEALEAQSPEMIASAALALASIVERDPKPEYVRLLPPLRAQLPPRHLLSAAARKALRESIRRITDALSTCKELPLPASTQSPGTKSLPRPS